jgi:hypothetical protein
MKGTMKIRSAAKIANAVDRLVVAAACFTRAALEVRVL